MSALFAEYGLFLAKTLTIVFAIVAVVTGIILLATRGRDMGREHLEVKKLNQKYDDMAEIVKLSTLDKDELKKQDKAEKKLQKAEAKQRKAGKSDPRNVSTC